MRADSSLQGGTATLPDTGVARGRPRADGSETRSYVRGSGLLLGGRIISIVLTLVVQVLTVRYLSKSDFGAFAYGLGIASIGSSVVLLGLGKAVPRFVPIYDEQGDHGRAFGTIVLAIGTVLGVGLSLVGIVIGMRGVLAGSVVTDPRVLSLLLVLIALAPINALDHLLQNLVAVFVGARSIFFRRYVLGPGLKLAAVVAVIALAGDVYLLAYGYLAGGLVGLVLYVKILMDAWRKQGLLRHLRPAGLRLPVREIFGFSIPVLSAELPVLLRGSVAVVLLEYFHSTVAVAEYRAVYPIAALNLIVFQSFGFLFVPLASRMFARADRTGIGELYWRTSAWITVLTFPVFAATFVLATPVTVLLFGAEYRSAGILMAILAVGYYFNAALGFNADALRVYGRVRWAVASDVLSAVVFVGLCLVLIPAYGAFGAAIGATATAVVHNIANQVGLLFGGTRIPPLDRGFVSAFLLAIGLLGGLLILQWVIRPPLAAGIVLVAGASLLLVRLTRHLLDPERTFPELLRLPLARWLLT